MVTLWAELAKRFGANVAEFRARLPENTTLVVSFDIMEVVALPNNKWNGKCLTQMRTLHSLPTLKERVGTKVVLGKQPRSPSLLPQHFICPSSELCIADFSHMIQECTAPFRATFKGVIMDLEELDYSKIGNELRRFKLVDAKGNFFRCVAMDYNASSSTLEENYEVVVFFALGRGPLGTVSGNLLLMKEAAILPLGITQLRGRPLHEISNQKPAGQSEQ